MIKYTQKFILSSLKILICFSIGFCTNFYCFHIFTYQFLKFLNTFALIFSDLVHHIVKYALENEKGIEGEVSKNKPKQSPSLALEYYSIGCWFL